MEDKKDIIDLRIVIMNLFRRKSLFIKVWCVTFILSCIWILPQPRYFKSETQIVPESESNMQIGGLSSLASNFGFNLDNLESNDAFYPELYPDVIATNEFVVSLFSVEVETLETEENPSVVSDYYTHITRDYKKNPITRPFRWITQKINELFSNKKPSVGEGINPLRLNKDEEAVVERVRDNISCTVDKKTGVITILVWDQDPLVAALMADSVRFRLQNFITEYRTQKARLDLEYYGQLKDNALEEFKVAQKTYSDYCDTHKDILLQSFIAKRNELENDVSTRLSAYNTMLVQYESARAKVQDRTPAFTLMSAPAVANRPQKPKRVLFVVAMLFVATLGAIVYVFRKDIAENIFKVY